MVALTIKDLPDALYYELQQQADKHHRTLDKEIVASLEVVLQKNISSTDGFLNEVRKIRNQLKFVGSEQEINILKKEGRE